MNRTYVIPGACSLRGLLIAALLSACGGGADQHSGVGASKDAGTRADTVTHVPPKPNSERPGCILSADCPAGLHCDLGECIQDCNTQSSCSGNKTCSARARCLAAEEDDVDPAPPSDSVGTLDVSPMAVKLTRAHNGKTLNLALSTNSSQPVRYRVQIDAPYLSVDMSRGTFSKELELPIHINTSNIVARDIPGTVTLYTTLGTTIVQLPLHAGLTGRYHGSLRYDGGVIPLGDTRFDLELIEKNGDVTARIAPEHSMLFPKGATDDDVAYGFGSMSGDGTVDLTIDHLLDAAAGGQQNHLARPIGRRMVLHLNAPNAGTLDGAFTESVYGLFEGPVQIQGKAHLDFIPEEKDPNFQIKSVSMPTITEQAQLLPMSTVSVFHPSDGALCSTKYVSAETVLTTCYDPLRRSMLDVNTKYPSLSENCKWTLGLPSAGTDPSACGCVTYAACAMGLNAMGSPENNVGAEQGALAQNLVAPGALVAQEELVAALRDSVANGYGFSTELKHYDTALSALAPAAQWLMQPGMLEFARSIPPDQAALAPVLQKLTGQQKQAGTESEGYPLARALAREVTLLVDVNAERQRVASAVTSADPATQIVQAQNSSVIIYLEALALIGVLDSWAVAPPSTLGSVAGVLTKLDHAFTDMTQDIGETLGTPAQHVPFVYRADDTISGTTNFEQKLTIAGKAVAQLRDAEADFKNDATQVDQAQYANATQLNSAKDTFDQQLHEICGSDFNLDPASGAIDWTKCGAKSGTLAELALGIQSAQAGAEASAQRAQGQKDKIDIDVHLVATKKHMRDDELSFLTESGDEISANTQSINMLNAMQEMISIASNSNLWNAGAPALAAVASYGLGLEKAGLEADNERLRQAQTMSIQETDASAEYADGMANIKREQIDLCEMVIEARQSVIGILDSQLKFANNLARAQELYSNRSQTNRLVQSDPSMDPAYRLVRNKSALALLDKRDSAQKQLLEAGRALEYEMNKPLPTLALAAKSGRNYKALNELQGCLDSLFDEYNALYTVPQPLTTQVSVRRLFGISGPRQDEVTGETLSEGQQFRAYVLNNQALDADGSLRIQFSTNLMPGNGLWSTDNCNDKISEVQAQLVGDFLGDNTAEIRLGLSGSALLRACDSSVLRPWNLDTDITAVIQAGVNTFGDVTNTTLFGQSVARATWTIDIRGGDRVPTNSDVDVTHLDDIVLKIGHKAIPIQSSRISSLDDSCLAAIISH